MRDLTGKICEIDYVGSSVRVLGKVTSATGVTHHFDFLTPFKWEQNGCEITREVGEGSCTDDNMVVKVWETA